MGGWRGVGQVLWWAGSAKSIRASKEDVGGIVGIRADGRADRWADKVVGERGGWLAGSVVVRWSGGRVGQEAGLTR
jgi:hypothetical protein